MIDQDTDKNETENLNEGIPGEGLNEEGVSIPNLAVDQDTDVNQDLEKPIKSKALWPFFVVIFGFLGFLGGLGYIGVKLVNHEMPDSVTRVETGSESVKQVAAPEVTPRTAVQVIPEAVIPQTPNYQISANDQADLPKPNNDLEKKLNEVLIMLEALSDIKMRLEALEQAQNRSNQAIDSLRDNVTGVTNAVEQIANYLRTNATKLDDIKTSFSNAKNQSDSLASNPQFRVAGKSVYGDTIYLTVTNDENFSSQITVGGKVGTWTLKSVDLSSKNSIWTNKQGVRREISIP